LAQQLRHVEQRGRADVGTMGEAEEDQERPPLHVRIGDRLAVLVLETERSTDAGNRLADGRRRAPGDEQDDAEEQHQAAEERGQHQHDARGLVVHRFTPVSRSTRQSRRGWSRKRSPYRNEPTARSYRRMPTPPASLPTAAAILSSAERSSRASAGIPVP